MSKEYYTLREQIDNIDLSLLPAVRAKGLFGRLDEGQFARIFINAYRAAENTELVGELQKRGWAFMDAVILDCPEIIPTLEPRAMS